MFRKVWIQWFLNIRTKILQNSWENIRDAVLDLITFQTKLLQLYRKRTPAYALFVEHATSEISSENETSSTGYIFAQPFVDIFWNKCSLLLFLLFLFTSSYFHTFFMSNVFQGQGFPWAKFFWFRVVGLGPGSGSTF